MVKLKICGITNLEDASAACSYGADALGFVFAKSPRRVNPQTVKAIIKKLPPFIVTVGVFVNEERGKVRKIAADCGLDCLQFHGDETHGYCDYFKDKYKIIKAIRVRSIDSLSDLKKYNVDAFLLDSYVRGRSGGTGVKFNWDLAVKAKRHGKPVILAGGIGIGNVEDAVKTVRPYAVDVSSAIEKAPGKKDHNLMKAFIERVHKMSFPCKRESISMSGSPLSRGRQIHS
ncbi:MAG: phosphoribosylanthranilate isomerase [Candidatus Omnitrophota bacterium]|nr:phosphoribosylanthranilate isomerase [Candidatus Omnitrophota bacterium]